MSSVVFTDDGWRVKGTVNAVTTYYVGDHYEVSGDVVKKYYTAGGQRIALRSGGTLYWLLNDHLGGTAHTLSGVTETGEVRYKAFGVTRFTSGVTPTSVRFNGQREEASLGLYDYNARWYDPALGHFLSPDTIVPEAGNALDLLLSCILPLPCNNSTIGNQELRVWKIWMQRERLSFGRFTWMSVRSIDLLMTKVRCGFGWRQMQFY